MRSMRLEIMVAAILMFLLMGGCIFDKEPPAAPILTDPPDKTIWDDINTIELAWDKVDDRSGVEYEVQIDNDNTFATPEKEVSKYKDCNIIVTSFKDGIYWWRVRAIDGAGNIGPWSEVRGFWIYSQPSYVRASGTRVHLDNNWDATDPTWAQLVEFLKQDKTDQSSYRANMYESSDFAQSIHNNAEALGVKASIVCVTFAGSKAQYLNAFNTKDKGLVYVDCTNIDCTHGRQTTSDKVAYVAKGKPYGVLSLDYLYTGDKPLNYYPYYEELERKWEGLLKEVARGDWSKIPLSSDFIWAILTPEFKVWTYMRIRGGELQLPPCWFESPGVVETVEIYW